MSSDEKKTFSVSDRRHFTPEGEAREESTAVQDAPAPSEHRPPVAEAAPGGPPRARAPLPPPDFSGLVLSLGAQASLCLIGASSEEGTQGQPDLDGARHFIALLEMLQEKTEGRRTADEQRVLQGILYELRMGYLERSRVVGA
jgi:hypothetical protein